MTHPTILYLIDANDGCVISSAAAEKYGSIAGARTYLSRQRAGWREFADDRGWDLQISEARIFSPRAPVSECSEGGTSETRHPWVSGTSGGVPQASPVAQGSLTEQQVREMFRAKDVAGHEQA